MLKGSIQHFPLTSKLLILVGMFFIGEFLFSMVALGIVQVIFPSINFYEFLNSLNGMTSAEGITTAQINAMKIFQMITSLGRFILVPLLFLYLDGQRIIQGLDLNKRVKPLSIFLVVLIMLTVPGVINIINEWNQNIVFPSSMKNMEEAMRNAEDVAQVQTDAFLSATSIPAFLFNLLFICVLAAVGEEILFRGVLQNLFYKASNNKHIAIWMAAFFFSLIHFQFFGFFPRMLLGALLGYLYYWSGSLWTSIAAHFVNNAAAVTGYFLLNRGVINEDMAEPSSLLAAAISLPLVVLLIITFRNIQMKQIRLNGTGVDDDILNSGHA